MIGLSIAPPLQADGTFIASSTVAAGRASQAADCAENSPQRLFWANGPKSPFSVEWRVDTRPGIINIRCVSTRQAIPP